ncbi:MAG TPA: helix-turn-helix domain-containing protein [Solirubrobacterales bacterium]|jgi:transcriptional regulator with XRE-family HTH domain|nr:helix-turn-helix domain-containing protein [Solirubrobacterales bacterium]
MTSGELIRDARRRHGLSQRRLALRAGASQAWISRLERNEVSPSIESLERLLLVMGEGLQLGTESLRSEDDDRQWREAHRARPMTERLERAFDAAEFASELRGAAGRR